MNRLISRPILALLATSCAHTATPKTAADHDKLAHHYDATADSIEDECWKDNRHWMTRKDVTPCWKAQDVRFLEANRNAAAAHRAEAGRLSRGTSSAKR